ncbi:MAG: hypothetical protein IJT73_11490, partial [Selenomonadaceae bacterium]|nr:hypothetical protein [Selenomonadaceae bacterium]
MKKIFLAVIFTLTIFFTPARNCEATDIWVAHWNEENVDIYVMDETIKNVSSTGYTAFSVSTKKVRDGQLVQNIKWIFSKLNGDMWRYETNTMDGSHTTAVL